jgi:Flp pilus assembly protein TadG
MKRPKIQDIRRTSQAPQRRKRSRGQALVEFAVVLPVFLLILSGVLDFGFLLYSRISAINAIKESAQCGTTGLCTVDAAGNSISWSAMQTKAATAATNDGLKTAPSFTCMQPSATSPITWSVCHPLGSTLMTALAGDAVQATATYQYQTFFPLLFGAKINVSVSNQMVIFPPPPPN